MDRRPRALFIAALLILPIVAIAAPAVQPAAAEGQLPPVIPVLWDAIREAGTVRAYVVLHEGASPAELDAIVTAVRLAGAEHVLPLTDGLALAATLNEDALTLLQNDTRIEAIGPVPLVKLASGSEGGAPPSGQRWWLGAKTGVKVLHAQGTRGQGTVVAVVDTGVNGTDPEFARTWAGPGGWYDPIGQSETPVDVAGHGSGVLSMVVDREVGVAPDATWIAARIGECPDYPMNCELDGSLGVASWQWMIDLANANSSLAPDVVVNSWGSRVSHIQHDGTLYDEGEWKAAETVYLRYLELLEKAGIFAFFSAGNVDSDPAWVPADYHQAFAVSEIDDNGKPWGATGPSFHYPNGSRVIDPASSSHKKPDLLAPGYHVSVRNHNGAYVDVTGTSYAASHAAGVALLVKQVNPTLTVETLRNALLAGSSLQQIADADNSTIRPNNRSGYGLLNAELAMKSAAKASRVLLLGDNDEAIETPLVAAGFKVDSRRSDQTDYEEMMNIVGRFGTLVMAGLAADLDREQRDLLEQARGQGVGIVVVGIPGKDVNEFDAVERLVELLNEPLVDSAQRIQPVEWSQSGDIVAEYFAGSVLNSTISANGTATIVARSENGSVEAWEFGTALSFVEEAEAPEDSDERHGAFFARRDMRASGDNRIVVLSNAMDGLTGNAPLPHVRDALLKAVLWARDDRIDPGATPIGPIILETEVVVVGDPSGQIVKLAREAGFKAATIPASDLESIYRTIQAEQLRRPAEIGVRVIVYNNVSTNQTLPTGNYTIGDVEHLRQSGENERLIPAVVLGGAGTHAFEELAPFFHYSVVPSVGQDVDTVTPHWINAFTPPLARATLEHETNAAAPILSATWTVALENSGDAPIAMTRTNATDQVAVVGVGAAADGTLLGENESAIIRRSITWAVQAGTAIGDLTITGDEELSPTLFRTEAWGNETYRVLNGADVTGNLTLRNITGHVRILNSLFANETGNAGLVIESSNGKIEVVGNEFRGLENAITVLGSPDVTIHHNAFVDNEQALRGDIAGAIAQNATDFLVPASFNYFDQSNLPTLAQGPTTGAWSAWASQYASSHLCGVEGDCPAGARNGVDPEFWVLPTYTRRDFSETFPCVDVRPHPLLAWVNVPDQNHPAVRDAWPGGFMNGLARDADNSSQPYAEQFWSQCWETSTTTLTLQTTQSNQFVLAAAGNPPVVSQPVHAAEGWAASAFLLPPGAHSVAASAIAGQGHYWVWETRDVPEPFVNLDRSTFAANTASWTLSGGAGRSTDAGRDGTPGVLRVPQGAAASQTSESDLYGLAAIAHIKLDANAAGDLVVDRPGEPTWPLLKLSVNESGIHHPAWLVRGETPVMGNGSWHRIEVRFAPPRADVYVDSAFVGSALMTAAPIAPGLTLPIRTTLRSVVGAFDADDLVLTRGETIAGLMHDIGFDDGSTGGVFGGGGGGGGKNAVALVGFKNVEMQGEGERSSVEAGPSVIMLVGDASAVRTDGFAESGGSSPGYGGGASVYVESSDGGAFVGLNVTSPLRRYQLEQYVSTPEGQAFDDFKLIRLRAADGTILIDVSLEDNNDFLDVRASRWIPNAAELTPKQWHKLTLVVAEEDFTLLVDDVAVLSDKLAAAAPVVDWMAGGGDGRILVDNIRFGHFSVVDSEPSRDPEIDSTWTKTVTTSGSGIVDMVERVPVVELPGEGTRDALLAGRTIRIKAPELEASVNTISRALPSPTSAAQMIHLSYFLPNKTVLTPKNDAFHVFRLDAANDPIYSLTFENGDTLKAIQYTRNGAGTLKTTVNVGAARNTWNEVIAVIHPNGEIQVAVNGTVIKGMSSAQTAGMLPTRLVIGDTISSNNPVTVGQTGSGEIYVDDFYVWRWDRAPGVWIDRPAPSATVGGQTVFEGRAQDPDENDAVHNVTLTLRASNGTVMRGPLDAQGTTTWRHEMNTLAYKYGSYTLTAAASDGRRSNQTQTTFTIDNRPVIAVASPVANSQIGGITSVTGTAHPRFPSDADESVDSLEYRIDASAWMPLPHDNGTWSFLWNTSGYSKATHTVQIRSTRALDTAIASVGYAVDNSPDLSITSPAPNSRVGGEVNISGTARDRYTTYAEDRVDLIQVKVGSGGWMNVNTTYGPNGAVDWWVNLDTHAIPKAAYTIIATGTEDSHTRTTSRSVTIDNTPTIAAVVPEDGSSIDSEITLRAYAIDPFPSAAHPHPESVYVEMLTSATDLILEPNATVPGRVDAWRNVLILTPGPRSVTFRAYDGQENAAVTVSTTVESGDDLALNSGVSRFATLNGPADRDTYKIEVPADATELRLQFNSFQSATGGKIYVKHGAPASPTSYDELSVGNGDNETLVLTALTGLRPGTYYVWLQGHGLDPTQGTLDSTGDYRLRPTVTRLGGGGVL